MTNHYIEIQGQGTEIKLLPYRQALKAPFADQGWAAVALSSTSARALWRTSWEIWETPRMVFAWEVQKQGKDGFHCLLWVRAISAGVLSTAQGQCLLSQGCSLCGCWPHRRDKQIGVNWNSFHEVSKNQGRFSRNRQDLLHVKIYRSIIHLGQR